MKQAAGLAAISVLAMCGSEVHAAEVARPFVPVTDQMLQNPADGDWLMFRRTLNAWGYSPLKQINKRNVKNLQLVWTRTLGPGVQEAAPLVYQGTMYFPNPSDLVQAIDAATGALKWEYKRKLPDDLGKYFPVPTTNRNLAIYDKLIIGMSKDDFAYALDAESGKVVWETKILEYQKGAQQTSGPIIVNGKAISGRGCEPEGGIEACIIVAHDAKTGKELWRTHTMPRKGELHGETWGDTPDELRWHVGTWMVPSYDPVTNLVYVGTSVTSPAPKFAIAGNDKTYLYHNSTLALDPDTGKIVWYYQHLVDHWDLDHPFERLIVDTAVAPDKSQVTWINPRIKQGERRRVIAGIPGKTGVLYTLDAKTGEFLWARPSVYQNLVGSIDGATGKASVNPEVLFHKVGDTVTTCQGRNWQTGAYSPLTNTMFFPLNNTCSVRTAILDKPSPESLYGMAGQRGQTPPKPPGSDGRDGSVQSFSVETGKNVWKFPQTEQPMSLVTTGGGLVFGGDNVGHFRAFDQDTGKVLWEINLNSSASGYPVSYTANGKQYIAISTGPSLGGAGPGTGVRGSVQPSANMYVFALPE